MFSLPRRVVLSTLVCLTALIAGCGHAPQSARDPESAANAFFAALEKGDPHAAYDSAAFAFQAGQTFDAFLSNAHELGLVGGQPPQWTRKDIHDADARLDGKIVSQTGDPIDISVTLTPDGGEWKLFTLHTATGGQSNDASPEDRFTLVGKGTGFNDVYHQPMPNPQQLADLIHGTMDKFNTAVRTADFHDFYTAISQQWKAGQRSTGEAVAGVTEKMLKDHFQAFIDQKIDLSAVESLSPVFDRTPIINQDGLLELTGHYDMPKFRLNFDLEYAYELPRWKLFGINLSLTK
jgi:hypothetical protein